MTPRLIKVAVVLILCHSVCFANDFLKTLKRNTKALKKYSNEVSESLEKSKYSEAGVRLGNLYTFLNENEAVQKQGMQTIASAYLFLTSPKNEAQKVYRNLKNVIQQMDDKTYADYVQRRMKNILCYCIQLRFHLERLRSTAGIEVTAPGYGLKNYMTDVEKLLVKLDDCREYWRFELRLSKINDEMDKVQPVDLIKVFGRLDEKDEKCRKIDYTKLLQEHHKETTGKPLRLSKSWVQREKKQNRGKRRKARGKRKNYAE